MHHDGEGMKLRPLTRGFVFNVYVRLPINVQRLFALSFVRPSQHLCIAIALIEKARERKIVAPSLIYIDDPPEEREKRG